MSGEGDPNPKPLGAHRFMHEHILRLQRIEHGAREVRQAEVAACHSLCTEVTQRGAVAACGGVTHGLDDPRDRALLQRPPSEQRGRVE